MIDDHAHTFSTSGGPLDLAAITLDVHADGAERRAAATPHRVFSELLSGRLAAFLGCPADDVPAARAEASADWTAYVRRLFDDAQLDELVVDIGAERDAASLRPFHDITGRPLRWLARFDPLLDRLIEAGADAATIVGEVEAFCADAAAAGCAGFKTAIAYRTGLAVDPDATMEMAQRSLESDLPVRRRGKACRDLALRRAFAVAADLRRPVQVHTGFGDSDLRLAESNPLLLEELLRTPEGRAVPVVLIHGSFPWLAELGHLAMTRPNVHAEVSLFNLFAPLTIGECLLRLLELAPVDRVIAGTDGHNEPETHWFAAHALYDGWRRAAATLRDAGAGAAWIARAHERIFRGNAEELYAG